MPHGALQTGGTGRQGGLAPCLPDSGHRFEDASPQSGKGNISQTKKYHLWLSQLWPGTAFFLNLLQLGRVWLAKRAQLASIAAAERDVIS